MENKSVMPCLFFVFKREKMTAPTKQELLDAVNTAIENILNGGAVASYSIGGRNLQRMSLSDLMSLRDKLQAETSAEQGTTNYAKFEEPV